MVKLSKLYTKNGDGGRTGLVGGSEVSKSHPQVEGYGTVDELNSWLGIIRSLCVRSHCAADLVAHLVQPLELVQQELFDLGAELATPADSEWKPPSLLTDADVERLEKDIDRWTKDVPELKSFLLPGGSELTSSIHVARTVCRRAERITCSIAESQPIRPEVIRYLNRLSDWLFALARHAAHVQGEEELLWEAERKVVK